MAPIMNSSESVLVTANVALIEELNTNSPISTPSATTPPIPASVTAGIPKIRRPPRALPYRLEAVREHDARDAHDDERRDLREQRAEQACLRDLDEREQGDLPGHRAQQDGLDRRVVPVVHVAELACGTARSSDHASM